MKYLVFLLPFIFSISGCGPAANPIHSENEILAEGAFRFNYPKDWKILSEEDHADPRRKITVYRFYHPKNKECYIRIEVMEMPKGNSTSSQQLKEIIAINVRRLRVIFAHDGYDNFAFKTSQTTLAGREATQLTITAAKGKLIREVTVKILLFKNNFYAVSYQVFSNWGMGMRRRIGELVGSFSLLG